MNIDRIVASRGARLATVAFSASTFTAFLLRTMDAIPGFGRALFAVGIACSVLTFLGLVFSFRPLYIRWMKFADVLQTVVMTILFGGCYLVIVPFFVLIVRASDPLRLHGRSERDGSYWTPRRTDETDVESFRRMA